MSINLVSHVDEVLDAAFDGGLQLPILNTKQQQLQHTQLQSQQKIQASTQSITDTPLAGSKMWTEKYNQNDNQNIHGKETENN